MKQYLESPILSYTTRAVFYLLVTVLYEVQ
jgi:hypothetical protein